MRKKILTILLVLVLLNLTGCTFFKQINCKHDYITTTVDATCQASGNIHYECKICGKEKDEVIPKTEHNFGDWEVIEDSTCSKEGKRQHTCANCKQTIEEVIEKKAHDYIITHFDATCTNAGYDEKICKNCNHEEKEETSKALGHKLTNWIVETEATEISQGLKTRHCERCEYKEEEIIPCVEYIDQSVIKFKYDKNKEYTVNTDEELLTVFSALVLNNETTLKCKITFKHEMGDLLSYLTNNCLVPVDYKIEVSETGNSATFTMTYPYSPLYKASELNAYTQYKSMNYIKYNSSRNSEYNGFIIESKTLTYNVSTSEQLFYCLEHGAKPICEKDSVAETLYLEAKKILISIIDDDMNDYEKIKAIHDYVVDSVCYDNDLLAIAYKGDENLKSYRGFYLEGALLDKRAVCEGISKLVSVLANIEGIPCVQVTGYKAGNEHGIGHAWNKVYVDGNWYVLDCTSDGTIINSSFEILVYDYFLISEKTMEETYIAKTYKSIECNIDYDYFTNFNYDELHSFNITNFEELKSVIRYLESDKTQNRTIQFKLTYSDNVKNEVDKAFASLLISGSYSYISNKPHICTIAR